MKKMKVLLVESNADHSWLTARPATKRNLEHEIISFEDGEDLLDYLDTKLNTLPKVIILDEHLPGMTGLEILKIFRSNSRYKHIPIFMLLSPSGLINIFELREMGATSYILKPLNDLKVTEALINLEYLVDLADRNYME